MSSGLAPKFKICPEAPTYYAISSTLVKWVGHTEWFKKMWKGKLDRTVDYLHAEGVEDTPYKDRNW